MLQPCDGTNRCMRELSGNGGKYLHYLLLLSLPPAYVYRPRGRQVLARGTTRPTLFAEDVAERPTTYKRRNVPAVVIPVQENADVSVNQCNNGTVYMYMYIGRMVY